MAGYSKDAIAQIVVNLAKKSLDSDRLGGQSSTFYASQRDLSNATNNALVNASYNNGVLTFTRNRGGSLAFNIASSSFAASASFATSASYALTSSYTDYAESANTANTATTATTATFAFSANTANTATTAIIATSADTAITASYVTGSIFTDTNPALSASYALTASYAMNGGGGSTFPYTGDAVISGSLLVSGSGVIITGSLNAPNITGSLFGTSSWAESASVALSSSYTATASYALSVSASAAGPNTSIQFNDNGTLSGSSNFTFNKSNNKIIISASATTSTNFPLLIDVKSGSTFGYPAVAIATQDGGGITLGYNGYPSTYELSLSPYTSGTTTIAAKNAPNGFKIAAESTKLILNTDLSFPIQLKPYNGLGAGTVEVSGSLTTTGSVFFKSLNTGSNITNVIVYDSSSGQVFYTSSNALSIVAGGVNTNIQFNSASVFSGSNNLKFDYTTNAFSLTGSSNISGSLYLNGFMTMVSTSPTAVAGGFYYDGIDFYLGF